MKLPEKAERFLKTCEASTSGSRLHYYDAPGEVFSVVLKTPAKLTQSVLQIPRDINGGAWMASISAHPTRAGDWRVTYYPATNEPKPHRTEYFKTAKAATAWADDYAAKNHTGEVIKKYAATGRKYTKPPEGFGAFCSIETPPGKYFVDVWHPEDYARHRKNNATPAETEMELFKKITGDQFRIRRGGRGRGQDQTQAMKENLAIFAPILAAVMKEFPRGHGGAGLNVKGFWDAQAARKFNAYARVNNLEPITTRTAEKYRHKLTPKNTRTRS